MAAVTHIGLFLCQQLPIGLRLVNGMTGGANNIRLGMIAATNIGAIYVLGMTAQAGVERLAWGEQRKSHDRLFAAFGIDVGLPGPVTALTPSVFDGHIGGDTGFVVRVPKKLQGNVGMAGAASHVPGVSRIGDRSGRGRRLRRQDRNKPSRAKAKQ
jgi:hypothetical protein